MATRSEIRGGLFFAALGALFLYLRYLADSWIYATAFLLFAVACLAYGILRRFGTSPPASLSSKLGAAYLDRSDLYREIAKNQLTTHFSIDGERVARIVCGDETYGWEGEYCGDCGVRPRQFHVLGCDMEECPKSHKQAISSPHRILELGRDHDVSKHWSEPP